MSQQGGREGKGGIFYYDADCMISVQLVPLLRPWIRHFKLHSCGRLLASKIGIWPIIFHLKSRKKKTRAIEKEKRLNADSRI